VFHVELRQFPHQARAFNLSRDELDVRILGPWVSGAAVLLQDRQWVPDKARLTIYEGPELGSDQLGLGRGWANVTREGHDVTAALLAEVKRPPAVSAFKADVITRCAGGAVSIGELVALAGERYPQSRVSERIGLCEQAVWELLHEGTVHLSRAGAPVAHEQWQATLLDWGAWGNDAVAIRGLAI
jgi:hypothetical protein